LKGKKYLWIETFAIVDDYNYDEFMEYRWYLKDGYAVTKIEGKEIEMGRMVLGLEDMRKSRYYQAKARKERSIRKSF
jgi:hypothetical protein